MSDRGHVELDRSVSTIVVGERHRRDPGDLTPLMDSMKRVGLLQPVTITPDGHLIGIDSKLVGVFHDIFRRGVGIVNSRRERMLRCEPVVH